MQTYYQAPIQDILFQLKAFGYEDLVSGCEHFEDFDLDAVQAMIEEYARYCEGMLAPLNQKGDIEGVTFNAEERTVTLPDGFKAAYDGFYENGFASLSMHPEHGGMGAPFAVVTLASEVLIASNKSFSMITALTAGIVESIETHGSKELQEEYLEKLVAGEWSGTMCLTEPQCGTDLGLLSTKAEEYGDHYKLTGTKIWITFGDHDLTNNIIHLVLARLPGAPPGIRGISTFIVPKVLKNGDRNPVYCGGTDHKMGINASPTCVINLEDAEGWLVGEPNKGMRAMFTMMNAARINVGIEGLSLSEAAYQAALAFAKDRRQSRSLDPAKQDKSASADNILVHPDVRRMLLNIKSTNEAMRGLAAYLAINYDLINHAKTDEEKERASDLVALLTPILKSYASERGFLNINEAMQVCGGAGFTKDWPIEQYMRDERIAMIYEGTNHIQALDLVGRKLPMKGGRLMRGFAEEVTKVIRAASGNAELEPFIAGLKKASKQLTITTMDMGGKAAADHELIGAVASNYLNQFAITLLGLIWIKQLQHAQTLPEGDATRKSKFQLARFYFEMVLPEADMFAAKVAAGKGSMVDIDIELL